MLKRLFYTTFLMFGSSDAPELPEASRIFGLNLTSDKAYYYTVLVVVVLCCAVIVLVGRSRLGRLLRGLGDSPAALEARPSSWPPGVPTSEDPNMRKVV